MSDKQGPGGGGGGGGGGSSLSKPPPMIYICGDCHHENEMKLSDPIRCRSVRISFSVTSRTAPTVRSWSIDCFIVVLIDWLFVCLTDEVR